MNQDPVHVTIATSSGALWLALVVHFGGGLLGLTAGTVAIVTAKGGPTHRRAGMLFVIGMIIGGVFAAGIALYERDYGSLVGVVFTAYLVFSGLMAVRPLTGPNARVINIVFMFVALELALAQLAFGAMAITNPVKGVPTPMISLIGIVALVAALGDWRLLRAGSIGGVPRVTRHLWRMCFGLFIASGMAEELAGRDPSGWRWSVKGPGLWRTSVSARSGAVPDRPPADRPVAGAGGHAG